MGKRIGSLCCIECVLRKLQRAVLTSTRPACHANTSAAPQQISPPPEPGIPGKGRERSSFLAASHRDRRHLHQLLEFQESSAHPASINSHAESAAHMFGNA